KMIDARVKEKLKEQDDKTKADEEKKKTEEQQKLETEGYRIGSLMNVSASFNKDGALWLKTPNEDFTMQIGYWLQWDNVFWTQSSLLRTPPGARPGPKQGV